MKKNQLILLLSIFVPFYGMANSTLEMIEKLDQQKLANQQQSVEVKKEEVPTKKERKFITISNGKRIDITDWRIVHFMSSTCSYCRNFNPKLKQISEQIGIPVITDFLINVNNLITLPVSQGDLSHSSLAQRLDETFLYIDKNLKGVDKLPVNRGQ